MTVFFWLVILLVLFIVRGEAYLLWKTMMTNYYCQYIIPKAQSGMMLA